MGRGGSRLKGETGHWLAAGAMKWAPGSGACRAACRWRLSAASLPLFIVLLLVSPSGLAASQLRLRQACSTCRGIADRFSQGLTDTAKKNFGGGNTAWEEKTLSKYETSEIRLVEIIDNLCDSSNFECNNMVEEHEEHIEAWWFKWRKKNTDLFTWLCIEKIEVCCPAGTYGPDCLACLGGSERPCHGNGRCDGDGTRGGDGSCSCNKEYKGEFCLECTDGYYNSHRNDTHSVCTACHDSCKTCSGAANTDCRDCKEGWTKNENACLDVDECAAEDSPCSSDQYCLNTDGSFSCKACDISCSECTGEGPGKCKSCIAGYEMEDENCTDVNECALPEKVCVRENEDCVNSPGGFKCVCAEGFEDKDGACAPVIKTEEAASENTSSPATHEDL